MSRFDSDLVLKALPDRRWELQQGLTFQGRDDQFTIKRGYITDLASVPKPLWWLIPPYGTYSRAAVLHDLLWQASKKYYKQDTSQLETLTINGQKYPKRYHLDPVDVDGVFRRAMRILGTNFVVYWLMWWAVRTAAMLTGRQGAMTARVWAQWIAVVPLPVATIVASITLLI